MAQRRRPVMGGGAPGSAELVPFGSSSCGALPGRLRAPALLLLSALPLLLAGCLQVQLWGVPRPLEETVVEGDAGPKILLLDVSGVLSEETPEPNLLGPVEDNPVSRVREQLVRARRDPEVRALLLRINSPGGTATASDLIFGEVLRFKQERGVPVVAQLMGVAASGGYYVAMAADEIVAQPTTVTGSIGVRLVSVSLAGLLGKLGIEDQTLVAGRHKDAGSPLRRMTPEERAQLQRVVDDLYARFESVVVQGRPKLSRETVARLADGSIYSAPQALSLGLVDALGGFDESLARARRAAGLSQARVVRYHRPREYANNLYTGGGGPAPALRLELPAGLGDALAPGFYFLWAPGAP